MNNFQLDQIFEQEWHNKAYNYFYQGMIAQGCGYEYVTDKERQLKGIDVILTKPDGQQLIIDEKARKKNKNKNSSIPTFGLEIYTNYGGNGKKPGWFLDETKLTTHYMFLYNDNGVDYMTIVKVEDLKKKLFSEISKYNLMNETQDNLNALFNITMPEGSFIYDDRINWEKSRFLLLPMSYYEEIAQISRWKL